MCHDFAPADSPPDPPPTCGLLVARPGSPLSKTLLGRQDEAERPVCDFGYGETGASRWDSFRVGDYSAK